jgi:membrane protease YdiL (CAAX protease family)
MKRAWTILIAAAAAGFPGVPAHAVIPAAVGWGNALVPGLGATLRGLPMRGFLEASTEMGLYYGGTYYAKEGAFTIDGTVLVPTGTNLVKPLLGQFMQEVGLKLHMYDTFYHYQQASLSPGEAEDQKAYAQPLYKGEWDDVLLAPFRLKNLETPWTYVPILLGTGALLYQYKTATVQVQNFTSSGGANALYAFTQGVGVPLGSSFGEEAFYRGFVLRELRRYTGSLAAALTLETALFTFSHQPSLRPGAAVGGLYLGIVATRNDGDLEPGIATHFWIDFISGIFDYLLFRKTEGRSVPLSVAFTIPLH